MLLFVVVGYELRVFLSTDMSPARFYFAVRIVLNMNMLGESYPLRHIAFFNFVKVKISSFST